MDERIAETLIFDADGFCRPDQHWDETTARKIADMDGIGQLDEGRMTVLKQLRNHYLRRGALPALPHICRISGFSPDCMHRLFPSPHEAWRVAGLPNPGEEAVAYL